jgi:predicted porin
MVASADGTQAEIDALKAQLKALTQKLDDLSTRQQKSEATAQAAEKTASETKSNVSQMFDRVKFPDGYKAGTVNMHTGESNPNVVDSDNFLQRQRDDSLTFGMPGGGGITLYGQLQVSADYVSNGLDSIAPTPINNGLSYFPLGKNGYLGAIATDSTYVGLRGYQPIKGWNESQFLWQLQTNLALSSLAANSMTNSQQSSTVSGAMTTGTSYIGLGGKSWGSIKVGKTSAPYANSTNYFDPFAGMLGSMNVVMGNTGGDNRIEFAPMMEHSIWYESPKMGDVSFAALFSPGQNRAMDSSGLPQGSADCAGGNIPGSGNPGGPASCTDGAFSNAFSTSLVYDDKKLYALAAYEMHRSVNRSSDLYGYAGGGTVGGVATDWTGTGLGGLTSGDLALLAADVGNEWAAKVGAMYNFESTGTHVGGIYEWMRRDLPAVLQVQNERSRNGFWVVVMQDLPGANQVDLGWAHAGGTPGDAAGQHNFNSSYSSGSSTADMYTIALVHQVDRNLSFWGNWADTVNHGNAHYDLGAGGHGIKTDCHDSGNAALGGAPANGGITGNPQCWGGNHLMGFSLGMKYRF